MNLLSTEVKSVTGPYESQAPQSKNFKSLQLTPEELRVLKECADEGIVKKAIPYGIVSGITGYVIGNLTHLKQHPVAAHLTTLGFTIMGYIIGKISYNNICYQRVLQVPDGNLKKFFSAKGLLPRETAPQYFAEVDVPKNQDTTWDSLAASSDIDTASVSNFDTVPSDYYQAHPEDLTEHNTTKNFNSYDDLRKQNREDYTNKLRIHPQQQLSSQPPQQRYYQQRRPETQDAQTSDIGKQKTKYGDVWD